MVEHCNSCVWQMQMSWGIACMLVCFQSLFCKWSTTRSTQQCTGARCAPGKPWQSCHPSYPGGMFSLLLLSCGHFSRSVLLQTAPAQHPNCFNTQIARTCWSTADNAIPALGLQVLAEYEPPISASKLPLVKRPKVVWGRRAEMSPPFGST